VIATLYDVVDVESHGRDENSSCGWWCLFPRENCHKIVMKCHEMAMMCWQGESMMINNERVDVAENCDAVKWTLTCPYDGTLGSLLAVLSDDRLA